MDVHGLRPWTEFVQLHPDVESGHLTQATFAIDLGAIASKDPAVPVVYRDPEEFFRATYLTADLRRLLEEVLASLAGQPGYNRVLKLRTPFGGGKSHTLAALLHAARARSALKIVPEAASFADPGPVDVAVFDGEKFDARDGKELPDGRQIRTMWGWVAAQLGDDKYAIVEGHDKDRVAPGGDVVKRLLAGRPKLLLLDEVLKYIERAGGVTYADTSLQRQALDFFQNLTVEVSGSTNSAMVYSLQWSAREALGNVALLQQLDQMAGRVDQLREPVTGDEILPILQRRLLAKQPDEDIARAVASAYQEVVTGMRRAYAETDAERQLADDEGIALRDRLRKAYPFHPALIDVMRERWCSLDSFQRTRGALRFLATCLRASKASGPARPVLGPGDVPVGDVEVRVALIKELGLQNEYDAVITSDIDGPNAKAKRIDDRLAREAPAFASVRPATRAATAMLMYSFGGLRREGEGEEEMLPPGVGEMELRSACVAPDLDSTTVTTALSELRNDCLFLHYDGVRYVFKKDPNVTKLVEDAEQDVARDSEAVKSRIKELLNQRLAGHREAIVWPEKSHQVPDEDPAFLVGYMPLEFALLKKEEQERRAKETFEKYGDRLRRYRNGVGLAVPDKSQIEPLRRAVRYILATERVDARKQQLRLSKDQMDQLRERRRTEDAAAESALRQLYTEIWLPRSEAGAIEIERVEVGGRPLQATGIHERILELITSVVPKVFGSTRPRKIVDLLRLGESIEEGKPPRLGIRLGEVVDAFYGSLGFPRLTSVSALKTAIARGVEEGVFAYTSGSTPSLGADGRYEVALDRVVFQRPLAEDEVDLETGFLMMPSAWPVAEPPKGLTVPPEVPTPTELPPSPPGAPQAKTDVRLSFEASRDQVFKAFPAIANLADKSATGKVKLDVEAHSEEGFDPVWLRNAVTEPLSEADLIPDQEAS
jgi:hypothetical protein